MSRTPTVAPESFALVNQLKAGTTIIGEIQSNGTFRIDGTLKGNITAEGKVAIGQTGIIEGNIICSNADIEGTVTGKLIIKALLSLKSTSIVKGEIVTSKLAIEPGSFFSGTCKMDAIEDQKSEKEANIGK
jgi:cytoskeletal protein CcmA (bactofilin family)